MNSELIIKTTIWEKENFELIDYLNEEKIETKIMINSSGVLRRQKRQISFNVGDNLPETSNDLVRIHKNPKNGKYEVNCGNWSKDLSKLLDEQGVFFVYNGLSIKELNKNYIYRYYKLSQGDIFKIGRLYFKVLDIHLKKEDLKSNDESSIKGTMLRSSSCNSIVINGQQVIKGEFTNRAKTTKMNKIHFNKKDQFKNNSILTVKNSFIQKNESLDYGLMNKSQMVLPKINSEIISIKKIRNNKGEKETKIKLKKTENVINTKPACRICYGEESNDKNPLICPC